MNLNLNKLTPIQTGANLFNTITADRINAIQDAIKELARGRNVIAGQGLEATYLGGAVTLSTKERLQDTRYRQIQEWSYNASDVDDQTIYNGKIGHQPYKDIDGLEIPLPRPNNIYDLACEPEPEPPLNVWSELTETYHSGGEFMKNNGDHFIFLKPGVFEIDMEYTAMHKAESCEAARNTHSFDLLFFPAISNKGKKPIWNGAYWDWIDGRTECGSDDALRVIKPQSAFVQYSIHGKQRLPPDHQVHIELFDSEKKVGLSAEGGIKYKSTSCASWSITKDSCAFVRDTGTQSGGGCSTTIITIPSCSLSSSNVSSSFQIFDSFSSSSVTYTQNTITKISENSTQISGALNFNVPVNLTSTDSSCVQTLHNFELSKSLVSNHVCPGWSSSFSANVVIPNGLSESTKTITTSIEIPKYEEVEVVNSVGESTTEVVASITPVNATLYIPTITEGTTSATGCCYVYCCDEEEGGGL